MIYFILDEERHLIKVGYTASDTPAGRLACCRRATRAG